MIKESQPFVYYVITFFVCLFFTYLLPLLLPRIFRLREIFKIYAVCSLVYSFVYCIIFPLFAKLIGIAYLAIPLGIICAVGLAVAEYFVLIKQCDDQKQLIIMLSVQSVMAFIIYSLTNYLLTIIYTAVYFYNNYY